MSLRRDFFELPKELQLAAAAAGALALSIILPWYQKSYFEAGKVVQANVSALGVFTFIEAAVLLVALAILFLVWARSQRKGFHLPGGDGVAITIAGAWAVLLLVWRLFDKPDIQGPGATMGIQWGIFGALLAAGALIAAGARVRAAHRPEPPNPAAEEDEWVAPSRPERARTRDRRPRDSSAVTDALRDRPEWEGDPGEAPTKRIPGPDDPSRAATRRLPDDATPTTRLPDDAAPTTRLPDDAGPDDAAPTRRLPDDSAPTARLPEHPERAPRRRRRTEDADSPRLWSDDFE